MGYRWDGPVEWLRDRLAQTKDYRLITYLNPMLPDLTSEAIEDEHYEEMTASGYFDSVYHQDAQEWFKTYFSDQDPVRQRAIVLSVASALVSDLGSDTLQDIFQVEMASDGYFAQVKVAQAEADLA